MTERLFEKDAYLRSEDREEEPAEPAHRGGLRRLILGDRLI
jgi:hypothetical protein